MNKRGGWALVVSIVLVVLLIIGLFLYFSLSGPNYDKLYDEMIKKGEIKDPAEGMSIEEAAVQFNESFVYYLLYRIKAYNLHEPPLSSDKPKIELFAGEQQYNAIIDGGKILVGKGGIDKEDIIIRTSAVEAVKMMKDENYVQKSFDIGESRIELVAEKSKLFAKGYLKLYDNIKGKSVTGNVIRIYIS